MSELAIDVSDLWFRYLAGPLVLEGVNLKVRSGEFVAIIGPNGAGKTTLVKHLNGLLKPLRGRVRVFGMDTKKTPTSTLAKYVGYVFQSPEAQIFAATIGEELSFGLKNLGFPKEEIDERVSWALRAVDLNKPRDASPHFLSFGEKHRLAIATVLAMRPRIIVLDEPFPGLDYGRCLQLLSVCRKLNEEGHTIILIAHDLHLISHFAKRAVILIAGQIVADGSVEEILSDVDLLNRCGFTPLQITLLTRDLGIGGRFIRVPELADKLAQLVRGGASRE